MAFKEEDKNVATGINRTLLTIAGEEAKLDGKFTVSHSIEIDCEVIGELEVAGLVTIQKDGIVNADVKTADAVIIGNYKGNMEASGSVEIKEAGIVSGDIKTDSLIIAKGGSFSGNVARLNKETKYDLSEEDEEDKEKTQEAEEKSETDNDEEDKDEMEL